MNRWANHNPIYSPFPIEEFRGNPLVEAINLPPLDDDEVIERMTQKPTFDPTERNLPPAMRRLLPPRLKCFMFPTSQHVKIMKQIYSQVIDGYRFRNPLDTNTQNMMHGGSRYNFEPVIDTPENRPSTISFLTGLSGMGKTTLIRAIMGAMGKSVIVHSNYQGKEFTESQILYLMRNVPDQCTPKILCKSYGTYTDSLLATKLYSKSFSTDLTRSGYVDELKKIITNHHVGALVLDEFQSLSLAGTDGVKELIAMLINFRDQLGVPIILVGTYEAADLLGNGLSLTRRVVDGGFHELARPESPEDEDWEATCEIMWEYQWVQNPAKFSDGIKAVLYDCNQGITAIMITLFIAAQIQAIDSGSEVVDANLLKEVYRNQLKPLHKIIDALRSKRSDLLSQYDDLYIKAFTELRNDSALSRMQRLENQLLEEQQKKAGVMPDSQKVQDEKSTTDAKPKLKKKNARTTSDLLTEVVTPPEGIFGGSHDGIL